MASPLQKLREAAVEQMWLRFPDADEITPQMVSTEICAHIYKDGVGHLEHTEVFVDEVPRSRKARTQERRESGALPIVPAARPGLPRPQATNHTKGDS